MKIREFRLTIAVPDDYKMPISADRIVEMLRDHAESCDLEECAFEVKELMRKMKDGMYETLKHGTTSNAE